MCVVVHPGLRVCEWRGGATNCPIPSRIDGTLAWGKPSQNRHMGSRTKRPARPTPRWPLPAASMHPSHGCPRTCALTLVVILAPLRPGDWVLSQPVAVTPVMTAASHERLKFQGHLSSRRFGNVQNDAQFDRQRRIAPESQTPCGCKGHLRLLENADSGGPERLG